MDSKEATKIAKESAYFLRDMQACAKSSLAEKTWLSARVSSVTLSCIAFFILIMLAIYCCVKTSRLHLLADIHMWYKQDREEAQERRAWGEGHAAAAAAAAAKASGVS